ncbi:MAG: hypothetical protein ACLTH6_03535 [Dorea longicatena]
MNLTAEGGMITLDQPCSILAARRQCWKEGSKPVVECIIRRMK